MTLFDVMNKILKDVYSPENQARTLYQQVEPYMDATQWQQHRRKNVIPRVKIALTTARQQRRRWFAAA